ncbi:MAG: CoB--CoM heterodisulfide reductase iron-sulfur subunit A family protein [Polyangiaceae bacterium]|jgi:quinone-modifying oxidoreductase subunit QmoA|nr:CoB--CoM heterodisulfide reductase iron-sulfur subunit A family protein [Polyangiaceae bacterium]
MTEKVDQSIVSGSVLVVGGGITGMSVALEAAEAGLEAHIVEEGPSLGGRVAQLTKYFPKLCPPLCGLEINFRRLRANPHVHVHTQTRVTKVQGAPGRFTVTLEHAPRLVNARCTACGECVHVCPVDRASDFDFGMRTTKAIYLPHALAYPPRFVVDAQACKGTACDKCVKACKYGAIDLAMQATTSTVKVGAVVVATGWKPYDALRLTNLGFGTVKDVITNMMMERMANPAGPTAGKIQRLSDGKAPETVAFVQCAGSRDENHLPYCSGICCMASLKQTTYVRDRLPDAKVRIFYIDVRTPGRLEDFYTKVRADDRVSLQRGKVARITESKTGRPLLDVEDTLAGGIHQVEADLVVLATGMEPNLQQRTLPFEVRMDDNGFGITDLERTGFIVAGCAKRPFGVSDSVQDATGAALRAIQCNAGSDK